MGTQKPVLHDRRQWGGGRGRRPYGQAQTTRFETTSDKAPSASQEPSLSPEPYSPDEESADTSTANDSEVPELPTRTAIPSKTLPPDTFKSEVPTFTPSTSTPSSNYLPQTSTKTSIDLVESASAPAPITSTRKPEPAKSMTSSSKSRISSRTSSQISSHAKAPITKSRPLASYPASSSGHTAPTSLAIQSSSAEPSQDIASEYTSTSSEMFSSDSALLPASAAIASLAPASTDWSSAFTSHASDKEYGKTGHQMSSSSYETDSVYSAASLYGAAPLLPEMDTALPAPASDIAVSTKAGIAVGTVCLGTALLGLAVYYFRRQRKADQDEQNNYKRSSTPSMTCIDGKDGVYREEDESCPTSPPSPCKWDNLRYSTVISAWGGKPSDTKGPYGVKTLGVKIIEPSHNNLQPPMQGPVDRHYPRMLNPALSFGGQIRKVSAFSDSTAHTSWDSLGERRQTLNWHQARSGLRRLLGMSRATSLSSASDPEFPVSARPKNLPIEDDGFLKVPSIAVMRDSSAPSQASSASHYPESVWTTGSMGRN